MTQLTQPPFDEPRYFVIDFLDQAIFFGDDLSLCLEIFDESYCKGIYDDVLHRFLDLDFISGGVR